VPLSEVVTSEFVSLLVIAWASSFWIIGFGGWLRGSGLRNMGYMWDLVYVIGEFCVYVNTTFLRISHFLYLWVWILDKYNNIRKNILKIYNFDVVTKFVKIFDRCKIFITN